MICYDSSNDVKIHRHGQMTSRKGTRVLTALISGLWDYRWLLKCKQGAGFNPIRSHYVYIFEHKYAMIRRRQWQPTPVLLPGKSTGQRSLGRLQSMGSRRVGYDWATSLSLFTFMHRRRKWQPTPVFLPGESQGRGSLAGCRLWGHKESDMTEVT